MPSLRKVTRGELAQWLEQRNHNPLVPSSNLGFATKDSSTYRNSNLMAYTCWGNWG